MQAWSLHVNSCFSTEYIPIYPAQMCSPVVLALTLLIDMIGLVSLENDVASA